MFLQMICTVKNFEGLRNRLRNQIRDSLQATVQHGLRDQV